VACKNNFNSYQYRSNLYRSYDIENDVITSIPNG
jgi:hypothetical protein